MGSHLICEQCEKNYQKCWDCEGRGKITGDQDREDSNVRVLLVDNTYFEACPSCLGYGAIFIGGYIEFNIYKKADGTCIER